MVNLPVPAAHYRPFKRLRQVNAVADYDPFDKRGFRGYTIIKVSTVDDGEWLSNSCGCGKLLRSGLRITCSTAHLHESFDRSVNKHVNITCAIHSSSQEFSICIQILEATPVKNVNILREILSYRSRNRLPRHETRQTGSTFPTM